MPVEDHPVHELTRQKADAKYGCHGKPRSREPLFVKNGINVLTGVQAFKFINDFGSLQCKYDMSATDSKCAGCPHRKELPCPPLA